MPHRREPGMSAQIFLTIDSEEIVNAVPLARRDRKQR